MSHDDPTPDAAFSLDVDEFRTMVDAIRTVEQALGSARIEPAPQEADSRRFRRSLFVVEDVAAGEPLTPDNVRSIRPSGGLHTREYERVIGKRARRNIARGTPLSWDLIEADARD